MSVCRANPSIGVTHLSCAGLWEMQKRKIELALDCLSSYMKLKARRVAFAKAGSLFYDSFSTLYQIVEDISSEKGVQVDTLLRETVLRNKKQMRVKQFLENQMARFVFSSPKTRVKTINATVINPFYGALTKRFCTSSCHQEAPKVLKTLPKRRRSQRKRRKIYTTDGSDGCERSGVVSSDAYSSDDEEHSLDS